MATGTYVKILQRDSDEQVAGEMVGKVNEVDGVTLMCLEGLLIETKIMNRLLRSQRCQSFYRKDSEFFRIQIN